MKIESLARLCHEAIMDFKFLVMKDDHFTWDEAEQWMRDDTIKGVKSILNADNPTYSMLHDSWVQMKLDTGWIFGEETDRPNKIHNCIVPFEDLSPEEQAKDKLFVEMVLTYKPFIDNM